MSLAKRKSNRVNPISALFLRRSGRLALGAVMVLAANAAIPAPSQAQSIGGRIAPGVGVSCVRGTMRKAGRYVQRCTLSRQHTFRYGPSVGVSCAAGRTAVFLPGSGYVRSCTLSRRHIFRYAPAKGVSCGRNQRAAFWAGRGYVIACGRSNSSIGAAAERCTGSCWRWARRRPMPCVLRRTADAGGITAGSC